MMSFGTILLGICTGIGFARIAVNLRLHLSLKRLFKRRATRVPTSKAPPADDVELPEREVVGRHASPDQFRCIECGSKITGGRAICPECRATQQRCIVCKQFIGQEELYSKCPHCEQLAHRTHLLEWLKGKETCPYCKRKLRSRDLS